VETALIDREAIQETRAAGGDEVLLAAPAARVRRVPRRVAAAGAIVMPELGRPGRPTRPVAARVVGAVGVRAAVGLRSGEDVVLVRRIADTLDRLALLADGGRLVDVVAQTRLLDGVAVQIADVLCDAPAFGAVPRPRADAIACVDGSLPTRTTGAQVRVPRLGAGARRGRERLTMP